MNPPQAPGPSRFTRGRGRGGYRPNFFFKRNGQTIPGNSRNAGAAGRGRSFRGRRDVGVGRGTGTQAPAIGCSFLRPQFHAVPEDAQQQIASIVIETPSACLGWRLYFYKEPCDENTENFKRIKLIEKHFTQNVADHNFLDIHAKGHFIISASYISGDSELLAQWPTIMQDILFSPLRTLTIIALAMHNLSANAVFEANSSRQLVCTKDNYVPKVMKPRKIYVRPIGFMPEKAIRSIGTLEVDQLYCIRGVVASIGSVEATASWVAYRCTKCRQDQALRQKGFQICRPYSCKRTGCQAKAGFVELRSSPYTRIAAKQMIRLNETHLDGLADTDPPYLNIELRHDLVDSIHLGQEIVVTGILKIRPLQEDFEYDKYSNLSGQMEIYMKACSILDAKFANHRFTEKDTEAVTMINNEPDSFKLLVQSLAPEVHGFEMPKAGVLLSLIGGSGSQVHDEQEINVLLVGDPGVGKSNVLQKCAKISSKAAMVQAKRGSTTANKLTVAFKGHSNCVVECGGLLTAKSGHCSTDDIDRLASQMEAIMNVLQSQVTTIAFPSLFSTLSTPTSLIATANSLRGHYDQSKLLIENIRITPQMLSEFHLVFILLDKPNKDMDTSLTEHIRALHAGRKKNSAITAKYSTKVKTNDSMSTTSAMDIEEEDEEYDLAARLRLNVFEETEMDLLPAILLKKFIVFCRQQVKPLFVPAASEDLKNFYMQLRQQSENAQYSISSSHLAGLIRLCQARARIDFSSEVTKVHVRDVICIVRHSNADMELGDYVDINPATATGCPQIGGGSNQSNARKFIQIVQMRANALSRRIFEFDELKDMARRAGISCGVTNIIDIVNLQGMLLKKGPNMYEVMMD